MNAWHGGETGAMWAMLAYSLIACAVFAGAVWTAS